MVRPLPAQSRPLRAAQHLETLPVTENNPVGDGTWIQPSEESLDSNDDITIDPHILNSMFLSTSLNISETETMIQSEQAADAITNIPETHIDTQHKVKEEVCQTQAWATKRNVPETDTGLVEQANPEAVQESTYLAGVDQVDNLYFVDRIGSLDIKEPHSKDDSKVATEIQKPATNNVVSGNQQQLPQDVPTRRRDLSGSRKLQKPKPSKGNRKDVTQESGNDSFASGDQHPKQDVAAQVAAQGSDLSGGTKLQKLQTSSSKGNSKNTTHFQEPATNYFASDYQYPEGVQRNVAAQGRDLYLRFLHEQMRAVRVPEPPCMDPWRAARLDLDYSVSLNASMRNRMSLRQMADAFACSDHRRKVQEQAALVDLESLSMTSFSELLYSLFQEGGVSSERIIVLFFFCVDLTIRALTEQLLGCFHQLIEWSQLYIVNTVSVWVQQNGGWSAVLEQSSDYIYKAGKIALACATIIALCIYIRRGR